MKTNHFTAEQIQDFNDEGYAYLPDFLPPERVAKLTAWTEEILKWPETPGKHMIYFEDEEVSPGKKLANRIENFVPYHEGLQALCTQSEMMECLAERRSCSRTRST